MPDEGTPLLNEDLNQILNEDGIILLVDVKLPDPINRKAGTGIKTTSGITKHE